MKSYLLHPATFKLDGGAMFGIIPKPLWEKKIQADEANRIPMALRVVLIQTDNKNILIDTGIGTYHPEKFQTQFAVHGEPNHLISCLEGLQLKPEDITDIIITHLHFDHVGGLGDKDKALFPNATVHVQKKHFEYGQNPTQRDQGSFHSHLFMPLLNYYQEKESLRLVEDLEGVLIEDGNDKIEFLTSFGHTPYMIHPIFDSHIYMADLVPMSHHVSIPWVMGYDINPGETTVYKEKFYHDIMKRNLKMIFEHDIHIWGGTLTLDDKNRYVLNEVYKSNQAPVEAL